MPASPPLWAAAASQASQPFSMGARALPAAHLHFDSSLQEHYKSQSPPDASEKQEKCWKWLNCMGE